MLIKVCLLCFDDNRNDGGRDVSSDNDGFIDSTKQH